MMRRKIYDQLFIARFGWLIAFLAAIQLISACALTPLQMKNIFALEPDELPQTVIEEVYTNTVEDNTVVTLVANAPFKFIVYKLQAPDRLAVEIAGATSALSAPSIIVGDELVGTITMLTFRRSRALRMEIELKQDYDFATQINGSSLDVTLIPRDNYELRLAQQELELAHDTIIDLALETEKLKEEIATLKEENVTYETTIGELQFEPEIEEEESLDETAGTEAEEPDEHDGVDEALIKQTLSQWNTAWKAQDIVDYSFHYSETFSYHGGGKEDWAKSKEKKFSKSDAIDVIMEGMEISVSEGSAVVSFTQHYSSLKYKDVGIKTLTMRKINGVWKIETEKWRPIR